MAHLKMLKNITFEEAKKMYENNHQIGVEYVDVYKQVHKNVYKKGEFHDLSHINWYLICEGKWFVNN